MLFLFYRLDVLNTKMQQKGLAFRWMISWRRLWEDWWKPSRLMEGHLHTWWLTYQLPAHWVCCQTQCQQVLFSVSSCLQCQTIVCDTVLLQQEENCYLLTFRGLADFRKLFPNGKFYDLSQRPGHRARYGINVLPTLTKTCGYIWSEDKERFLCVLIAWIK